MNVEDKRSEKSQAEQKMRKWFGYLGKASLGFAVLSGFLGFVLDSSYGFRPLLYLLFLLFTFSGVFLLSSKRIAKDKNALLRSVIIFLPGSFGVFLYTLFYVESPFGTLLEWAMLLVGSLFTLSYHLKKVALAVLAYLVITYLIRSLASDGFVFQPNPWIGVGIILFRGSFVITDFVTKNLDKIVFILKENLKLQKIASFVGQSLNSLFSRLRKRFPFGSPADFFNALGSVRIVLLLLIIFMLLAYAWMIFFAEVRDGFNQNGFEVMITYSIGLFALSLVQKEKPAFSAFFSAFGWVELIVSVSKKVDGHLSVLYSRIHFTAGRLAFSVLLLCVIYYCVKQMIRDKEEVSEVIPLGPLGYVTLSILICQFI